MITLAFGITQWLLATQGFKLDGSVGVLWILTIVADLGIGMTLATGLVDKKNTKEKT